MRKSEAALDSHVRRTAKRAGYIVRKSRWRLGSIDNYGEYVVIDPECNFVVFGGRYDATAEDVLHWLNDKSV
jgi:hypothetical protein